MYSSWQRTRIEPMCIIISFSIPHPLMPPGSSKTSGCPALPCSVSVICLENGLSVIAPKPYKERTKRTEYFRRVKNRDVLCEDIDLILQKKPESFDTFLQELQQLNYEIKYGKHILVRGKNQTRFIRLSSLEDGYTEADLRAHFLGQREHKPAAKQRSHTNAVPSILSLISRASCSRKVSDISGGLLSTI